MLDTSEVPVWFAFQMDSGKKKKEQIIPFSTSKVCLIWLISLTLSVQRNVHPRVYNGARNLGSHLRKE